LAIQLTLLRDLSFQESLFIELSPVQKRASYCLKISKFNSELENVEENSVSLTGRQARFRGTGCTIESASIFE
jgi:hypothetical protein